MPTSITDIKTECQSAHSLEAAAQIAAKYADDPRTGVQKALLSMVNRVEKEETERKRVLGIYDFERDLRRENNAACLSVGLDEVGRGPLAGPVAIGAVVFDMDAPDFSPVFGINDSKKLSEHKREELVEAIESVALAHDVIFVPAHEIDEIGIAAALRKAFAQGIESVEGQLAAIGRTDELELVILDGNPMHLDEREVNVVKGDAKVASISAASIIAKVQRDKYMEELDEQYPQYGFAGHKGYGSAAHIAAIKEHGLCPEHRVSFCKNFV